MASLKKSKSTDTDSPESVALIDTSDASSIAPKEGRPSSGDYVLVGCKMPHGLWMENVKPGIDQEKSERAGPGRPAPIEDGERIKLNGANAMYQPGFVVMSQGMHPYGLTRVPRELAERWFEDHAKWPIVKNGLIFMAGGASGGDRSDRAAVSRAHDMAEERAKEKRTGLEALTPAVGADGRPVDPRLRAARKSADGTETDVVPDVAHYNRLMRQASAVTLSATATGDLE